MGLEASQWDGAMFVPNLETKRMVVKQPASWKDNCCVAPVASKDAVRRLANVSDCANMFDSSFYIFINLLFQIEN
jgi:hypothetical protein